MAEIGDVGWSKWQRQLWLLMAEAIDCRDGDLLQQRLMTAVVIEGGGAGDLRLCRQ